MTSPFVINLPGVAALALDGEPSAMVVWTGSVDKVSNLQEHTRAQGQLTKLLSA